MGPPPKDWHGPIYLSQSIHANPRVKAEVDAVLKANPKLKEERDAGHVLNLIRAERKAEHMAVEKAGPVQPVQGDAVQIAQAQNEALEQQVAQHTASVGHALTTLAPNIRQILVSFQEAVRKENTAEAEATLESVDSLWQQLEKLFEATQAANDALPYYLDKQKENIALIAVSKIQEGFLDAQKDSDMQRKKANLANEIILTQQQAFNDYKLNTDEKLKAMSDMEARMSNSSMESKKASSEIRSLEDQLKQSKAAEQAATKKATEFQEEVAALVDSKKSLLAEKTEARSKISDLEAKLKVAEQKANGNSDKEVARVTELFQKEQQKTTALDTHLKNARLSNETAKKEAEKAKSEWKQMFEKYKNQSGEYAKVSDNVKEKVKKISELETKIATLQHDNNSIEKSRSREEHLKNALMKQVGTLKSEIGDLQKKSALDKEEIKQLSAKLKQAADKKNELEAENADLRAKQTEHNKAAAALKKAEAENASLRTTVQDLKNKPAAINGSSDTGALKKEVDDLNEKLVYAEKVRAEWERLGRNAMNEYHSIKAVLGGNADIHEQLKQAQQENERLKAQATKTSQSQASSPPGGSGAEAAHWKKRYNDLVVLMEKKK